MQKCKLRILEITPPPQKNQRDVLLTVHYYFCDKYEKNAQSKEPY